MRSDEARHRTTAGPSGLPRRRAGPALRPASPGKRPYAGLAGDDRGQIFLLLGLLLVIGFITLGSVFIEVSNLEEKTARSQRDEIVTPLNNLVDGLNRTVRGLVQVSETNVTDFVQRGGRLEDSMRVAAARQGIYLDVKLDPDPDPAFFWRESRCATYLAAQTADGVVVGYDALTGEQSIVGAVYQIHATDGRETVRFPYYAKIQDCLQGQQLGYFSQHKVNTGTAQTPANAQDDDDGDATMSVAEEGLGNSPIDVEATGTPGTQASTGWTQTANIFVADDAYAKRDGNPLLDYVRFHPTVNGVPNGAQLNNVTIRIDAFHTDRVNDNLRVKILDSTGLITLADHLVPTTTTEATYRFAFPLSPSLNAWWTEAELEGIYLQVEHQEVIAFDPSIKFDVDYLGVEFDYDAYTKHGFNVEFSWPKAPALYNEYVLELRYGYDTPSAETVRVDVWDYVSNQWNEVLTLTDNDGALTPVSYTLAASERDPAGVKVRIRDSDPTDGGAGPADTVFLEYVRLVTSYQP